MPDHRWPTTRLPLNFGDPSEAFEMIQTSVEATCRYVVTKSTMQSGLCHSVVVVHEKFQQSITLRTGIRLRGRR